ncbi:hypothetical protein DWB77_03569 [Streptomyces hundungensis]|uniref:DUF4097 domain-containing protein n=1 Tax=Streptomyces hundungensis TaxID=1077946 RepID=A0A387HGM7_9ACTN|nr:DUF4097 family beta strand repeat-containing protein [Streptomyces hundungensis]AYG81423.1 hypothetical protein DWB77_03569 [Streptomyces hundungensis]
MTTTRLRTRSVAAVPRTALTALTALTVLAVGALGGCGPMDDTTFKDDTTVKSTITAVRIDGTSDGFRVRGKQGLTTSSVHREVTYRGKKKPTGSTYRVENGVLVLGGCAGRCSVDYVVDVPAGIPVTGSTKAGGLSLSAVGQVQVSTGDGAVKVRGATGPVDIRTSNGSIDANGLKGTATTARTSNGAITLTPATVQDVTAQTSNGSITVTAPRAPYRVSAQSTHGHKALGITDAPSAPHHLTLTTTNGAITLNPAK